MGTIPVLVDDRPTEAAVEGLAVVGTQAGGLEALARCDVVVKAPGISRYRAEVGRLADAGVPVTGGLALWLAEADLDRVLVVTGTKGKSTTAALAGHLASGLGRTVVVGATSAASPTPRRPAARPSPTCGWSRSRASRPPICRSRPRSSS